MENNTNTIDLINGNTYQTFNLDNSFSVYNMFINQTGQLQTFPGYESTTNNTWAQNKYLCHTTLKATSTRKETLILVEREGILILQYNNNAENFVQIVPKLLFVDARFNIFPNAQQWNPNLDRYSIIQSEQEIIYITDGSTGGLYVLYLTFLDNGNIDNNVYFKQFQYQSIQTLAGISISPVDENNNIVNLVFPAQSAYLSTHIIFVDDKTGGMYVLDNLILFDNPTPLNPINYANATLTPEIKMQGDPGFITTIKVIDNDLYVMGKNSIEKWYAAASNRPIQRYPNVLEKTGVSFRKAVYVFNNMLFFLGSSDDQQFQIKLWGNSANPVTLGVEDGSNLNVLFTNVKNFNDITFTAVELWGQMFGIVNFGGRTGYDFSILIDLKTQKSFYLIDKFNKKPSRFLADELFRFDNKYFFISWNINEIYKFDYKYTSYNGNRIECSIKTQYFFSQNNKLLKASNFNLAFSNLPQYYYSNVPHSCIPVLQSNANTIIQILTRTSENKWSHWNNMYIPINRKTFHRKILENIVVGYNIQIQIHFFQASSLKEKFTAEQITSNRNLIYFPVIVNNATLNVVEK